MTLRERDALAPTLEKLMRAWGPRWGVPRLEQKITIEWSERFRCALGRAFPQRGVVRLSAGLASAPVELLREVLCHEVAHVVVVQRARWRRPHGPEWATLVRLAGFEPRARIPWTPIAAPRGKAASAKWQYLHRCPVCHVRRTARRPIRRWRCAACVEAGLHGRLEISREFVGQR
jgi:predicted SprT family Zn-dependent metalloprotease